MRYVANSYHGNLKIHNVNQRWQPLILHVNSKLHLCSMHSINFDTEFVCDISLCFKQAWFLSSYCQQRNGLLINYGLTNFSCIEA